MKTQIPLPRTTCPQMLAARLLFGMLLWFVLPTAGQAQFAHITNGNTITITGYAGPSGAITIPDTINGLPVIGIGESAFSYAGLSGVTIPNSVTRIGNRAFLGCAGLTSVTLGNRVTSIGFQAFYGCHRLTGITIPSSLTSIDASAFFLCTNLNAFMVEPLNPIYSSVGGVLFNWNRTTLFQYPAGKAGNYSIPDGVTTVGVTAFSYGTLLTNVTIPDSVTIIDDWAFGNCTGLTSINIPYGVITIGDFAFAGCNGLTGVTIPESVIDLGRHAFTICTRLKGVSIGNNVRFIRDFAFEGCTSLTGLRIGNRVVSIGHGAFYRCTSLTSVRIPDSVTGIGENAFSLCASLTSVRIPDSVIGIGNYAFARCPRLTSATIGNSVTRIGSYAFYGCSSLACVVIGNNVTAIGSFAFQDCSRLKGVYFEGDRPSAASNVFIADEQATIYPLSGTTGWGSTFAGRPTVVWNPLRLPTADCIGVRSDEFGFTLTGPNDSVIVVEASPDLANPVWSPVATNTLPRGSSYFSDPQWAEHGTRLYRLRSP